MNKEMGHGGRKVLLVPRPGLIQIVVITTRAAR
jgi:hypothetical protein